MNNLGIVMVIGLVITIITEFNQVTKEKVADSGKMEITMNKSYSDAWLSLNVRDIRFFGIKKAEIHFLHFDPKGDSHDHYKLFKAKFNRKLDELDKAQLTINFLLKSTLSVKNALL